MDEIISVIVPIYNAESFLEECIRSILNQTYQMFELILIDDGSVDGSYNICDCFAKSDKRIRTFHNSNHGVSYTRNYGIDRAVGEYLCFVDADDVLMEDYLETLLTAMRANQQTDVVYCGHQMLYGSSYVKKLPRVDGGCYTFQDLSHRLVDDGTLSGILFGSACSALYRNKVIQEKNIRFLSNIKKNEDGIFNLYLLQQVNRFAVIPYNGYIYRQWKSGAGKKKMFTISNELDKASVAISEMCQSFEDWQTQIRRRNVSVVFWNLLTVLDCKERSWHLSRKIKQYISGTSFYEDYHTLDFGATSIYKRFLVECLYRKQFFLFSVMVKYVKPILEKVLVR